jgi:hypothetical protein
MPSMGRLQQGKIHQYYSDRAVSGMGALTPKMLLITGFQGDYKPL